MANLTRLIQTLLLAMIFLTPPMGHAMETAFYAMESQRAVHQELQSGWHNLPRELWTEISKHLKPEKRRMLGQVSKALRDKIRDPEYLNFLNNQTNKVFLHINKNPGYSSDRFYTLYSYSQKLKLLADNANLSAVKNGANQTLQDHALSARKYLKLCEKYVDYNLNKRIISGGASYGTFQRDHINQLDFAYLSSIYNYKFEQEDGSTVCCLNFEGQIIRTCSGCQESLCQGTKTCCKVCFECPCGCCCLLVFLCLQWCFSG